MYSLLSLLSYRDSINNECAGEPLPANEDNNRF